MALKKQSFDLIYIDAFAGAGRSKIRTVWTDADEEDIQLIDDEFMKSEEQFIEGSPRRALGLENPFSHYYFFDADAGRAALLEGLQSDFPQRKINVQVGDANGLIQKLVPSFSGRSTKGVAFLDPYGPHLDWQTVAALGATKNFEVIINFPLGMAINRLITRSGDIPDNWRTGLNGCFGNTDWEDLVYAEQTDLFGDTMRHKVDDAAQRLLNYYVGRLKDLFGHASSPSVVRNTRGVPIYYMLWAGPHPLGYRIADYILSKGDRISPPKKRATR
jgi:three-Cys-motif partner protein